MTPRRDHLFYGTPHGGPGTPGVPSGTPQTMTDVENLVDQARKLLAQPDLDADLRTRLDAALGRLRTAADEINDMTATAAWVYGDAGDARPCRYVHPNGRACGYVERDMPSHGESFAGHPYAPERRAPRPAIGPGSDRRAVIRGTGE